MSTKAIVCASLGIVTIPVVILVWIFVGLPQWRVWEQGLAGQAKLREAEFSRQVLIQEAHARYESAKLLAQAEVERAKGVAQANQIIGEGLKGNHEYLIYLWIHSLGETANHVIYVPTEAGLPVLEAGRFQHPVGQKQP